MGEELARMFLQSMLLGAGAALVISALVITHYRCWYLFGFKKRPKAKGG